jgi:Ca2+-binding RTX toxin-like protein
VLLGSSGNDNSSGDPATDILIRGAGNDVLDSGRDNILIQSSVANATIHSGMWV